FIGLQNAGIIVNSDSTLVKLGDITSGAPLLALIGLGITSLLLIRKVNGALLLGILITTIIGAFMGITQYKGIVSLPPSPEPLLFKFDFSEVFSLKMVLVVFTFLFVDLFDTLGTLVGVTTKAKMLTPDGKVPGIKQAFMADAVATTLGAMMGTSTVTTYVESAAGVAQGGRTGLTSLVTASCFVVALLFSPLFLSITPSATAPVLILVGLFMLSPVVAIDFDNYSESIPAFICILAMPLSYSIAEGISLGMISYVVLNLLSSNQKKLNAGMCILAVLFILKYFI
ncbi:MAG: NCS2 family permease, partial [Bacteroides sp.]